MHWKLQRRVLTHCDLNCSVENRQEPPGLSVVDVLKCASSERDSSPPTQPPVTLCVHVPRLSNTLVQLHSETLVLCSA
jgi:hypothetical protein